MIWLSNHYKSNYVRLLASKYSRTFFLFLLICSPEQTGANVITPSLFASLPLFCFSLHSWDASWCELFHHWQKLHQKFKKINGINYSVKRGNLQQGQNLQHIDMLSNWRLGSTDSNYFKLLDWLLTSGIKQKISTRIWVLLLFWLVWWRWKCFHMFDRIKPRQKIVSSTTQMVGICHSRRSLSVTEFNSIQMYFNKFTFRHQQNQKLFWWLLWGNLQ